MGERARRKGIIPAENPIAQREALLLLEKASNGLTGEQEGGVTIKSTSDYVSMIHVPEDVSEALLKCFGIHLRGLSSGRGDEIMQRDKCGDDLSFPNHGKGRLKSSTEGNGYDITIPKSAIDQQAWKQWLGQKTVI